MEPLQASPGEPGFGNFADRSNRSSAVAASVLLQLPSSSSCTECRRLAPRRRMVSTVSTSSISGTISKAVEELCCGAVLLLGCWTALSGTASGPERRPRQLTSILDVEGRQRVRVRGLAAHVTKTTCAPRRLRKTNPVMRSASGMDSIIPAAMTSHARTMNVLREQVAGEDNEATSGPCTTMPEGRWWGGAVGAATATVMAADEEPGRRGQTSDRRANVTVRPLGRDFGETLDGHSPCASVASCASRLPIGGGCDVESPSQDDPQIWLVFPSE